MRQNRAEILGPQEWKEERETRIPPSTVNEPLYQAVDKLLGPKYQPQLVARGGEHLVFELRDQVWPRNVVVKVNFNETLPVYKAYDKGDKVKIEMEKIRLDEKIKSYNRRKAKLKEYFGSSAVPAQLTMVREIPMNPEIAGKLRSAVFTDSRTIKAPAWISVQRRIELDPEKTFSLTGYYLEAISNAIEPELYDKAHSVLSQGDNNGYSPEEELDIALEAMEDLDELPAQMELDPEFKSKLQETARDLIKFEGETGIILDLAGNNNMVLVQEKGGWHLKMPDVLFTDDSIAMHSLKSAAERIRRGEELDFGLALKCYYILNTVRVINALAVISGIPERLRIKELQDIDPETWRKNFKQVRF
ncbi:MAG: hypothetical protein WC551_06010 [Patescibacteria group bacterium]